VASAEEGKISKGSRLSRARGVREAERGQVLIAGAVGRHSFLTRQPKARGPDVFGREVDEVGVVLAVGAWRLGRLRLRRRQLGSCCVVAPGPGVSGGMGLGETIPFFVFWVANSLL
jgi:hypothetical protein